MRSDNNWITAAWRSIGTPKFLVVFIAIWTSVVLLSGIPYGDLSGYDDAAYAHEAKSMLQTGDVWTLNLNGNPDFDKPPFFIWVLALSFKLFGTNDVAAKIPSVLFGWASIILVYFLAKELFRDEPEDSSVRKWLPVLAMLCMATTQYFLKNASHAMTDVPFTFLFTLAIYFFVLALRRPVFLPASGVATGLAMLVRSPIGLFPAAVVVLCLIFIRRYKLLLSIHFLGFLFFTVAIPAVWFLREYGLFGDVFVTRHLANLAAHSAAVETRSGWQQVLWHLEYFFLIVRLYIPWFPMMFYGLFLMLKKLRVRAVPAEALLFIWLLVVVVPFSFADSKVLRYILPAFPVFAVFSAYALHDLLSRRFLPALARFAVAVLTAAAFFIVLQPHYQLRAEDMRAIAPVSDAAARPDERVLLYTSGEFGWNYQNQLLWYGNRNTILSRDLKDIDAILSEKKQIVVIMDKPAFAGVTTQYGSNLAILGESKNFVCFRIVISD